MKITINDHRKVAAIQKEFNSVFPDLKLEFHARPSKGGAPPAEKLVKAGAKTLLSCRNLHTKGVLELFPGMSAEEIKENFRDAFGLSVEILPAKSSKAKHGKGVLIL